METEDIKWKQYKLGDIAEYQNGRAFKKSEWKKYGLPIIRIQNLTGSTKIVNYADNNYDDKFSVKEGDLLLSWSATLGVYNWIGKDAWLNQHIFKVNPNENIVTKDFCFYILQKAIKELSSKTHGTGMVHITKKIFEDHLISLPEKISDQIKLTKKLDDIGEYKSSVSGTLISSSIKASFFRQAILHAAVTGKLTKDWRIKNPKSTPVQEIINKIKTKRLDEAKTASKRKGIERIYAEDENNSNSDLPEEWEFVSLAKLCKSFDYGTSKKSSKTGKIPVLRMGNLQEGSINWENLVYTSDKPEVEKYKLQPNTVLFNRTNSPELVGKTSIYKSTRDAIFAGYLIRIVNYPELDPDYLNYYLNSSHAKSYFRDIKTDGVSQSNINAQKLSKVGIPYCSIQEQKEIVKRVEKLFALQEDILKKIGDAEVKSE